MTAQTERLTFLSTPEFKVWLTKEAKQEGISVSELVRRRCQAGSSQDEELLAISSQDKELLAALIVEVRKSTKKAEASLDQGLKTADEVLAEIRTRRKDNRRHGLNERGRVVK